MVSKEVYKLCLNIKSPTLRIVFLSNEDINIYTYTKINNDKLTCVKLEHGLQLKVREDILNQFRLDPYIQVNFNLNIKRLNRWWYSVYFDMKEVD